MHTFAGHIACDSASNAEIVVPIVQPNGAVVGVLDVDSPSLGRCDDADRELLEVLAALYASASTFGQERAAENTSPKQLF